MKSHKQGGTSYISVKARNSEQDMGLIMTSTRARVTEIEALAQPPLDSGIAVTDTPDHANDAWCSLCGWRPRNRFNANAARASGLDNYCRDCRKKIKFKRLMPKDL